MQLNPSVFKKPPRTSVALCRVYNVSSANISDAKWLSTGKESGSRTVEDTNLPIVLTITSNTMKAVIQIRDPAVLTSTIVDDLIRNTFFNSDDEDVPVEHALREFGSKQNGMHYVVINTPLRFKLAVKHLSVGLSFRQSAVVIRQHHDATANP
ncbi:hypothetical protein PHMEG_00034451 [Phytophthora megakarya]|uniref:Uncharacterized protein n=1 Tax=Phytophthora megakarya TaxID=4795 RepID=A0A225UR06_9STRA|nr:hypothetical protein PHMEG_00034451 [Phytophthora megakarya]